MDNVDKVCQIVMYEEERLWFEENYCKGTNLFLYQIPFEDDIPTYFIGVRKSTGPTEGPSNL